MMCVTVMDGAGRTTCLCLSSRLSSAKPSAPVILDGKRESEDEEDEDEQFLVEEAIPPPPDASDMDVVSDLNSTLDKNTLDCSRPSLNTSFFLMFLFL